MRDRKPSALEMLQRTEGYVTDEILEALGAQEFPEKLPQPPQPEPPSEPSPQASPPIPEGVSREDFLKYHLRLEKNPEQFAKVAGKMRAWAALHPEDERKWDTDYSEFNKAYDSFNKEILRTEHRLAGHAYPLKFHDELEQEKAAEAARNSAEARARAEREEDERLRAALKAAYSRNDQMTANAILEKLAERVLRS